MPRKKAAPKSTKKPTVQKPFFARVPHRDAEWGGFCNCRLTDVDKEAFDDWFVQNEPLIPTLLHQLLLDGMKVSVTYDLAHSCCILTLTGTAHGGCEMLISMSSRAPNFSEALALSLYKHIVVLGEDWQDYMDSLVVKKRGWG